MKCEEIRELMSEALTGELDASDRPGFEAHIAGCEACAGEFRRLNETWTRLGVMKAERPSAALADRFYAMLEAETAKRPSERNRFSWKAAVSGLRRPHPAVQFAAAALLLVCGAAGGFFLASSGRDGGRAAALQNQVEDMRQTTAVALLQQASPSDRLRGLGYSEQVSSPRPQTLDALLRTLDSDPNINVRLAAADALYLFAKDPAVKDGILRSLPKQDSPLVQVALIDLLVDIRERRAAEALKALIGNKTVDSAVRRKAELGVQQLSF